MSQSEENTGSFEALRVCFQFNFFDMDGFLALVAVFTFDDFLAFSFCLIHSFLLFSFLFFGDGFFLSFLVHVDEDREYIMHYTGQKKKGKVINKI